MSRGLRVAVLALGVSLIAVGLAAPADARKFQMSGTWMMRQGQTFIPLQFAGRDVKVFDYTSMGLWTWATPLQPEQVASGVAGVTATDASPARVTVAKHAWLRSHDLVLPLLGTMLVQITTMLEIDAPHATAMLAAGGGPGDLTWCPGNPACVPGGFVPLGGRIVYAAGANQFGGTMQMGLRGGGVVAVKGVGPGLVGHVPFLGSGSALRRLAVGGAQMGPDTPATELVKLAPGVFTAPIGGIPASGMLITMPGPIVGMFPSIPTPMGGMTGQFTTHWGFGHTTGTVIVQQSGSSGPSDLFTLMGSDARTPLGAGNLSVVAGGLILRNTLGGDSGDGAFHRITMAFGPPVPSLSPAGVAAASTLIVLAAGYALRRRIARAPRSEWP